MSAQIDDMKAIIFLLAAALSGCATRGIADTPLEEAALSDLVEDRIEADARLRDAKIRATTNQSVVVLAGTVQSAEDAALAERIAAETGGVLTVLNELRVRDEREDPTMFPIYDEGIQQVEGY